MKQTSTYLSLQLKFHFHIFFKKKKCKAMNIFLKRNYPIYIPKTNFTYVCVYTFTICVYMHINLQAVGLYSIAK